VAAQTEGLESSTGAGRRCDIAAGPALCVEQNKYAIGEAEHATMSLYTDSGRDLRRRTAMRWRRSSLLGPH